jgi:hypothetical protein
VGSFTILPIEVSSSQVGDGSSQRSTVQSFSVTFNQPVSLGVGAFTLQQSQDDVNWTDVSDGVSVSNPSGDLMTWVFTCVAGGALDRTAAFPSPMGYLQNGIYQLTLHGAGITAAGVPFNRGADMIVNFASNDGGAVNGTAPAFHVLFGDVNGDGVVNGFDALMFKKALDGQLIYNAAYDYQGDGVVNGFDAGHFKRGFGVIEYSY